MENDDALDLSATRLREVVDRAPDGIFIADSSGRYIDVNAAGCSLLGFAKEELVGTMVADRLLPEDLVRLDETVRYLRTSGRAHTAEWALKRKDGVFMPVELSSTILPDGRWLAFVRDVSALKALSKFLDSIIENVPAMIFLKEAKDLRFERFNRAGEELLGVPRAQLIGKNDYDLFPKEQADHFQAHDRETLSRRQLVVIPEEPIDTETGRRWLYTMKIPILDERGVPTHLLGISMDIGDRKRAEEALQRSEEALNRAQRIAHLGSWSWDARANEIQRSGEMLAIFGVDPLPQHAEPFALAALIPPEDRAGMMGALGAAVREGTSFEIEHRIVRPDGTERVVLHQGLAASEDGFPIRVFGTVLDITERKRADRAREESLRWLQAVLDQSPVGMLLVHGPSGERIEANRRALRMAGRPLKKVGDYPGAVTRMDGRPLERNELPSIRALHGDPTEEEFRLVRPDGDATPVFCSAAPIVGADGSVEGAVVTFQDITATKELERLRGEWSSVVAHDLRQPLTSIALNANILAAKSGDSSLKKPIERIQSAAARLSRMVGDLMDLSRLEAQRMDLARQRVGVATIVRSTVDAMEIHAPDRPFETHIAPIVPDVEADPDRLAQVMENLLTNAIKYGTPGRPIVVDVGCTNAEVVVAVTNEGRALTPEEMTRIFERFQRTERARLEGVEGIGLGLYITRAIVEAHGGHITVDSTPAGVTSFRFTLPAALQTS